MRLLFLAALATDKVCSYLGPDKMTHMFLDSCSLQDQFALLHPKVLYDEQTQYMQQYLLDRHILYCKYRENHNLILLWQFPNILAYQVRLHNLPPIFHLWQKCRIWRD